MRTVLKIVLWGLEWLYAFLCPPEFRAITYEAFHDDKEVGC
jgi:hypothetical protein